MSCALLEAVIVIEVPCVIPVTNGADDAGFSSVITVPMEFVPVGIDGRADTLTDEPVASTLSVEKARAGCVATAMLLVR